MKDVMKGGYVGIRVDWWKMTERSLNVKKIILNWRNKIKTLLIIYRKPLLNEQKGNQKEYFWENYTIGTEREKGGLNIKTLWGSQLKVFSLLRPTEGHFQRTENQVLEGRERSPTKWSLYESHAEDLKKY